MAIGAYSLDFCYAQTVYHIHLPELWLMSCIDACSLVVFMASPKLILCHEVSIYNNEEVGSGGWMGMDRWVTEPSVGKAMWSTSTLSAFSEPPLRKDKSGTLWSP
ncbi:hypothetical protein AJ80_02994 [Polytolypa hystricis UAMH7299]|uniref:Uncharacterized protein n=1 Tax=Polytolypa hystricis (strain UAMH7299) TaxID=1447883 RepID=A0A2B7YNR3_POLH7|nr:hypothetical protein AJ80_02994 [Polytolypa hystricis UAMH7299]